ncbi:MAG TPA: hypothetical protein DD451_01590 [Candidatus Moranbacteria bacterium]|nr:hypothetical protein [Candidatus Moranbacteria bacterium]
MIFFIFYSSKLRFSFNGCPTATTSTHATPFIFHKQNISWLKMVVDGIIKMQEDNFLDYGKQNY